MLLEEVPGGFHEYLFFILIAFLFVSFSDTHMFSFILSKPTISLCGAGVGLNGEKIINMFLFQIVSSFFSSSE